MSGADWLRNLSFKMVFPSKESRPSLVYLIIASLNLSKKAVGYSLCSWLMAENFEKLMGFLLLALSPDFTQILKYFFPIPHWGIAIPLRVHTGKDGFPHRVF